MTLASALVRTPVGFSTDFVDPNASPLEPWMAQAINGTYGQPPPVPQQPAAPPMIRQQDPSSLAAALTAGGSGNGSGAATPGTGQVPTDMLAQALVKNSFPTGPMY